MGFCTRRYFFLSICLLQMVSVVQRQVFDFLGFLWIPILVNFFEIIFIIFGFFGAYQYRPKYIIAYLLWHIFWLGWNIFLICLYLNVAGLDHEKNKVLKLDLNSDSWWKKEGPGCKVHDVDAIPVEYEGCLINYVHVEIVQASVQGFLTLLNSIIGICLSRMFLEEDDTSSRKSSRKNPKQRMSFYSIEFNSHGSENRHDSDDNEFDQVAPPVSPKPMTPRRVKRRSVMTRGTTSRQSTGSTRSSNHRRQQSHARSSTRSNRRVSHQNPVTRLLEQQQQQKHQQQQQQQGQAYDSPASQSPCELPLPNYFSNSHLHHQQTWQPSSNGHANPTYQQSSQQSLNDQTCEDLDDLYNNRPASVRSSYSNFHGTRTISYSPPKQHFHSSHATPQVPQKRNNPNRNSMRSMAFLNNGPPAYSSQNQLPIDSETPM